MFIFIIAQKQGKVLKTESTLLCDVSMKVVQTKTSYQDSFKQAAQRRFVNGSEMPPSDCGRISPIKLHPLLPDSAEREWVGLVSMGTTDRKGARERGRARGD